MTARVLYVSQAGERGGAEVILLNLLKNLNRNAFEPFVISLQDGPFVRELEETEKSSVAIFQTGRFRQWKDVWNTSKKIQEFIQSRKIGLVHNNGTGAQIYGGIAARMSRIPSIYHMHDTVKWMWNKQGLIHFASTLTPATARIAVSNYVANQFASSWGKSNTVVIHNAVANGDGVATSSVSSREVRVVWCGRIQRWKGVHIF